MSDAIFYKKVAFCAAGIPMFNRHSWHLEISSRLLAWSVCTCAYFFGLDSWSLVTKCYCRFHLFTIHSLFTINSLFSEPGWNLLGRGDSWAELELCWDLSRVGRPSCIGTCAICAKDKSPEMHRYCMILSRFVKGSRSQVILPGLLLFFHASFQRLQPCFCFFCLLFSMFFLSCNHWGMPEPCRMCKLNWQPS